MLQYLQTYWNVGWNLRPSRWIHMSYVRLGLLCIHHPNAQEHKPIWSQHWFVQDSYLLIQITHSSGNYYLSDQRNRCKLCYNRTQQNRHEELGVEVLKLLFKTRDHPENLFLCPVQANQITKKHALFSQVTC